MGTPFLFSGPYVPQSSTLQPPIQIPSNITWSTQTIATASSGNALRGLVIAYRCARCHGKEGFSDDPLVPNVAGMDKLAMWKQLVDFRDGKRKSRIMQGAAAELATQDYADLAAYYSMLPTYPDAQDPRSFPQVLGVSTHTGEAARLISAGDGQRGIPPCQACHGPIGHKTGAPSLVAQNAGYIREELMKFAEGSRSNDINMPMRTIAALLTDDEKQSLAAYYGAGLARLPVGASVPGK
jgi:cytochrome c553